ncbi:MAG TPA: 4Fe-4S dicluster domain-containing protein [Bryobacteraceae bacterium]|nr:4Fe-4S dicluster domain-containing protein [Bryobacteraceae bacterium]
MSANLPAIGTQFVLELPALAQLIASLCRRGYRVVGPTLRGNAIVCDILESLDDLPAGWTADQESSTYRLRRRGDGALFAYAVGPQGWKRFLYPAEAPLFEARREGTAFRIVEQSQPPPRYAFLGMRSCELAAMAIQDHVLLGEPYGDPIYRARRQGIFVVAVNCTVAAPTCFCTSMHSAPPAEASFDIALTELVDPNRHLFVAEAGSRPGSEVLGELQPAFADVALREEAAAAVHAAMASISRKVNTKGIRELLYDSFEHPHWSDVATRCLGCGNCNMVCPTCFCTTVEDATSISGDRAARTRKWDSCFSQNFSYIHGGSVRMSMKSRYRQWATHKFAAWIDQFGSSGCVGCGRCITWCPAGIDITAELAALRETPVPAGPNHMRSVL